MSAPVLVSASRGLDVQHADLICLVETQELVRTLQSLAMGRKGTRVLLKKPAGKEVNPTDIFAWNKGFSSDRIKFKINQIQQDMTVRRCACFKKAEMLISLCSCFRPKNPARPTSKC